MRQGQQRVNAIDSANVNKICMDRIINRLEFLGNRFGSNQSRKIEQIAFFVILIMAKIK
jgi:hypothetical protein